MNLYLPSSEFLNYVLADEIAFDETPLGQANLQRLLAMVTDEDRSNRDWAAFLISGLQRAGGYGSHTGTPRSTKQNVAYRRYQWSPLVSLRVILEPRVGGCVLMLQTWTPQYLS